MMGKNLVENLENKKKYLFLSINSSCLKYIDGTRFIIPADVSEEENFIKSSVPHKIVLGLTLLKLTSFESSGFFDERFDTTFSFGMNFLLQKDYFVYDCDGLKKEEMAPMDFLMKKVIRRKGKFEYGDELLIHELDLNDAAGIMFFTKDSKKNIKDAGVSKKIISFDLIKDRSESFTNFEEFDKKVQNGEVREFEWN